MWLAISGYLLRAFQSTLPENWFLKIGPKESWVGGYSGTIINQCEATVARVDLNHLRKIIDRDILEFVPTEQTKTSQFVSRRDN
jgi:hypothetical protein